MQFEGVAWLVGRFIQFQGHAVRTRRTRAVAVILPTVASPEAHTAHHFVRRFDFQAIRAPLHREGDFSRFIGLEGQFLLAFNQIFLIKLRLPAIAL